MDIRVLASNEPGWASAHAFRTLGAGEPDHLGHRFWLFSVQAG